MLTSFHRSDADSDVLAEYVIALLKHDGDEDAVRKLCEQEIPDFLTEGLPTPTATLGRRVHTLTYIATEPKAFLDDVFQAIKYRSYVPGAPPPPKQPPAGLESQSAQAYAPAQGSSRKRAFDDQADFADVGGRDNAHGAQRAYKQPRRGGRRGMDDNGGFPGMNMPTPPGMPPGMPQFDPNNPMEALMQMQAMGMPFPAMSNYPHLQQGFGGRNQRNQPRRRGRCRDFDTKGYCSRGSTCMYDHGNESVYVPSSASGQGKLAFAIPSPI